MKKLYVLYDGQCAFCRRCRIWLSLQPAFVPLAFIPLQSPEVTSRFPGIEAFRPDERMVVISSEGAIWRGEAAWITCLWALREYRAWSFTLAQPALRPFARRFYSVVSENRHGISRWMGGAPGELQAHLAATPEPACKANICRHH